MTASVAILICRTRSLSSQSATTAFPAKRWIGQDSKKSCRCYVTTRLTESASADLDRMTRRVRHLIELVEDLFVGQNKHLMSVAEQIDTNTPMGRACLTILSAIAQLEREQIAERVKEVLEEKIRRGERTGTIPYGFEIDPCDPTGKLLVPHPGERENIGIAKQFRADGWSYHRIAEELTRRGIPTKTGNEKWIHTAVRRILMRPEGWRRLRSERDFET